MNIHVGDTVTLDEIEVYVLAAKDEDGTWNSDAESTGVEYIGVDKNHDLSYYFAGSDYVDEMGSDLVIDTANKYGYEWGGYGTATNITATSVGSGLSNTNSLIEMNLQPSYGAAVWDKIKEFRESHSDQWFLPSMDELILIYEAKNNLSNLSLYTYPFYWSSSEYSSRYACYRRFNNGDQSDDYKYRRYLRSRLCRYITDSELEYTKKTWIDNELITSTEFNRIENRTKELYPAYESHEWSDGEIITSERLNSIETQLGTGKTWVDNEIITEDKLNAIEDHLVN